MNEITIAQAQKALDDAEAIERTQQDALNIAHDAWQVEVEKMRPLREVVFSARTTLRIALRIATVNKG